MISTVEATSVLSSIRLGHNVDVEESNIFFAFGGHDLSLRFIVFDFFGWG